MIFHVCTLILTCIDSGWMKTYKFVIKYFQFDRTAIETAEESGNFHIVEYLKVRYKYCSFLCFDCYTQLEEGYYFRIKTAIALKIVVLPF